jgi:hypothetical protein
MRINARLLPDQNDPGQDFQRRMTMRWQQHDLVVAGSTGAVFAALCRTLAFRRWPATVLSEDMLPEQGRRYSWQTGSVRRIGRIVEVVRPIGISFKEVLDDPPCRVILTMRWRIDPIAAGCGVRLGASYRLSRAAVLRRRHWDERLHIHFRNQFTFLAVNLARMQAMDVAAGSRMAKRDLLHH